MNERRPEPQPRNIVLGRHSPALRAETDAVLGKPRRAVAHERDAGNVRVDLDRDLGTQDVAAQGVGDVVHNACVRDEQIALIARDDPKQRLHATLRIMPG